MHKERLNGLALLYYTRRDIACPAEDVVAEFKTDAVVLLILSVVQRITLSNPAHAFHFVDSSDS